MVNVSKDLYPFESHFLKLGEHRLHYVDEGERDAPVLLMVHGNPTWSFFWRHLIKAYRKNYRVIAIDHMGCGLSDKPQEYNYTLEQHIRNLSALSEQLGLQDITLMVHDWGGAIGMGYAVRNASKIKKCVVFNTAAFHVDRLPLRIALCRVPVLGKLLVQGLNGFARAATFMTTKKPLSKSVKQSYLAPYNTFANRIATYQFVMDIPVDESHPTWETLAEIEDGLEKLKDKPMVIFWGGLDWVFNDRFFEMWKQKFPMAEFHYFENAGHYILEDAHTQIVPKLERFLKNPGLLA